MIKINNSHHPVSLSAQSHPPSIRVTSDERQWRHTIVIAFQITVQQLVQANYNETIYASLALCEWNSSVTGRFPSQWASNVENISILWRHPGFPSPLSLPLLHTVHTKELYIRFAFFVVCFVWPLPHFAPILHDYFTGTAIITRLPHGHWSNPKDFKLIDNKELLYNQNK